MRKRPVEGRDGVNPWRAMAVLKIHGFPRIFPVIGENFLVL
jgi:hypothetical protein